LVVTVMPLISLTCAGLRPMAAQESPPPAGGLGLDDEDDEDDEAAGDAGDDGGDGDAVDCADDALAAPATAADAGDETGAL